MATGRIDTSSQGRSASRARALRRSSDRSPGYTRRVAGKRFAYFDSEGKRIRDAQTIARIDALAIPPAACRTFACRYSWRASAEQFLTGMVPFANPFEKPLKDRTAQRASGARQ